MYTRIAFRRVCYLVSRYDIGISFFQVNVLCTGNRYDLNSTFEGEEVLNQQLPVLDNPVYSAIDASSIMNSSLPILAILPSYERANASAICWWKTVNFSQYEKTPTCWKHSATSGCSSKYHIPSTFDLNAGLTFDMTECKLYLKL